MPGILENKETIIHEKRDDSGLAEKNKHNREEMNVANLTGRVCYFSLAGDLAQKAYIESKLSTYKEKTKIEMLTQVLVERLYFAVLMFDNVVLHCSDPLRSTVVLDVLEQHRDWIKEGKILFIFSNDIKDIRRDYRSYIREKINEYSENGFYSEKEAASLKQSHMTDSYYERVISLLDETPILVRKTNDPNFAFANLVLNDLNPQMRTEQVIVDSQSTLSHILSLNLTLYQLLNVRGLNQNGKTEGEIGLIFPSDVVVRVINEISEFLGQDNSIARSAIVDALKNVLQVDNIKKKHKILLNALTLRMDVLYCRMNSGKQLILEFHPSYEHRSMYNADCFAVFLKVISGNDRKIRLSQDIIKKILEDPNLGLFRYFYLACMADTRECLNLIQSNTVGSELKTIELCDTFKEIVNRDVSSSDREQIKSICNILRGV